MAISYSTCKWQPSLNKSHTHGNDIRPVERKQNCLLSEKGVWIAHEIIKVAGNKEKKKNKQKNRGVPKTALNPNDWKSINLPPREYNRYCSSPRHPFHNNTMNDGIKLSTHTSFVEKGTVQHRKSRFKYVDSGMQFDHKQNNEKL